MSDDRDFVRQRSHARRSTRGRLPHSSQVAVFRTMHQGDWLNGERMTAQW
ncbi:MAG: hypothetical protein LC737_05540 [Chloroflexi bacterium]|nr:hypothetical protein [Chloroflexota bacterium]